MISGIKSITSVWIDEAGTHEVTVDSEFDVVVESESRDVHIVVPLSFLEKLVKEVRKIKKIADVAKLDFKEST